MESIKNKEIKVKLVDSGTLTYKLLEAGNPGDWFSLVSEIQNYIEQKTKEKIKQKLESFKSQIRNDIFTNDDEIKQMKETIRKLSDENSSLKSENQKETANLNTTFTQTISKKDIEITNLRNEIGKFLDEKDKMRSDILANDDEIKAMRSEISQLKEANANLQNVKLEEISNLKLEHKDEINEKDRKISHLENKFNDLEEEKNNSIQNAVSQKTLEIKEKIEKELEIKWEEKIKQEKSDLRENFKEQINKQEEKIQDLEEELNKYKEKNINSKEIGENLENWILERYKSVFPLDQENDETISFSLKKDTENLRDEGEKKATKADFIFTIFDKENEINETVILEAKSESKQKPGKQKNKDFFKKLENDRIKKRARYAILVTELEPDQYITIEIAPKFPKIFICRPHFYLALLMILKSMIIKEKKLTKHVENLEEKEKIIKDFEDWKNNKVAKTAEKIRKKSEKAMESSQKIIDEATEIQNSLNEISNTLIRKLENTINNFKITKLARKVETIKKKEIHSSNFV
ncbi:DUF2130 domain-containing protein [Mesomycoplasma hyopneumoniae]|uniref:DUF2130 domain-containing protein n=1 Tax=Mesomycoplasma hyopneumoniae TaxID=2099 RepID=UPI002805F438|nr:DUF2130 domain-containing protein [Mesomycoplasma hyopneumoniae]